MASLGDVRRRLRATAIATVAVIAASFVSLVAGSAALAKPPPEKSQKEQASQKTFPSPDAAAEALVAAARAANTSALVDIFGPESKSLVESGDPVADRNAYERFVKSYDEAHKIVSASDSEMTLETGNDQWPFPIPLVKAGDAWHFDTAAGKQEILDRRIGANELATIEVVRAFVDAEREYFSRDPDGDKQPHYAQLIRSTPGKRDGLYWEEKPGEPPSPLGALFAEATAEGYHKTSSAPIPYHGYYYRILTAQGPHAAGGQYDYIVRGKMIGGFALVAYPAEWRSSGVMTFLVNHDGVVFQKDLGPDTAKIAKAMKAFDPDDTWTRVQGDGDSAAASPS
ncbi:MAG TPA: DUF2950 domain-containing protein [Candidatus Binatia bacterium]|nr:DUF2950 domain-containing protein [Candidatus Binatia bacterium]